MPLPSTRVIHPDWSSHHAPAAAGAMTGLCVVRDRGGPPVFDPDTGASTAAEGPVLWSGRCRVQASDQQPTIGDQGGQEVTTGDYLVQLDETHGLVPVIPEGATVTVTASRNDPHLVGRPLVVVGVLFGTERFVRDLVCSDNQG